ncbi:MAG: hypothetical protein ABDH61_03090, partial [Acidilobaceae archaeon]
EALAPSLGIVEERQRAGDSRYRIYLDAREFIAQTYVTREQRELLKSVANLLLQREGRLLRPPSGLGGGKTGTLSSCSTTWQEHRQSSEAGNTGD